MNLRKQILGGELMGDLLAAKVAQIACYTIATGVFVLAMLKLTRLPLTEADLFFGILQIIAVFTLMICAGTLVRMEAELRRRNTHVDPPGRNTDPETDAGS